VKSFTIPVYNIEKGEAGRVFEIFGTEANVKIATYIYDFILGYIERQWKIYSKKLPKGSRAGKKNSFGMGIILGFDHKLDDAHSCDEKYLDEEDKLIHLADKGVSEYCDKIYPKVSHRSSSSTAQFHSSVHAAGMEKGRELVIHKGVENSSSRTRGLITT
jgi:hypothetical protein